MLRDQQILYVVTVDAVRCAYAKLGLDAPSDAEIMKTGDALGDEIAFGACIQAAIKRHLPGVPDRTSNDSPSPSGLLP
jgi:hypothetical protein